MSVVEESDKNIEETSDKVVYSLQFLLLLLFLNSFEIF
jgi:hypothetical protein